VSLSGDGSVVAFGAPLNSQATSQAGRVSVYRYNPVDGWQQLGADIHGDDKDDFSVIYLLNLARQHLDNCVVLLFRVSPLRCRKTARQ
jgi:hypothetical protein